MVVRTERAFVLLLTAGLIGGCTTDSTTTSTRSVVDSAGVEIITNPGALWSAGEGWSITESPALRLGSIDGPAETLFGNIRSVGWFDDGRIFVADEQARAVRVFSADGTYLGSAGGRGQGPGELQGFLHVRVYRGDSLFVSDYAQGAVSVFGPDLEFARRFLHPSSDPVSFVRYALSDGRFVTFGAPERPSGMVGLVPEVAPIVVMAPDGSNATTVGSFESTVWKVAPDGTLDPLLIQPRAAFLASGDRIYWTRGDALEFVEAAGDGTIMRIVRTADEPVPVDGAILANFRERYVSWAMAERPDMDPERVARVRQSVDEFDHYPTLPKTSEEMLVDPLANRWISRYHFEGFPAEEWEVFDSSGTWLGRVQTPPGLDVHAVGVNSIVGVTTDEYGTQYVQVHELVRDR